MRLRSLTCPHCGAQVRPVNKPKHIEFHATLMREIARAQVYAGVPDHG